MVLTPSGSGATYVSPYVQFTPSSNSTTQYATVQHVEAVVTGLRGEMNGLKSEIKGELATVMASIQVAESKRSADYERLSGSLEAVRSELPTKATIWKVGGTLAGGLVAVAALLWAVFDTGASITSGFADNVLADKKQQDVIESKLDTLILDAANHKGNTGKDSPN